MPNLKLSRSRPVLRMAAAFLMLVLGDVALPQSSQAQANRLPAPVVPDNFCLVTDDTAFGGFVRGLRAEMGRNDNHVMDIAVRCDVVEKIHGGQETQLGEWIIYAVLLNKSDAIVIDAGMEQEAFLQTFIDQVTGQAEKLEALARETGNDAAMGTPLRRDSAVFWPGRLQVPSPSGPATIQMVSGVTLLDRTPVFTYWYVNPQLSERSADALMDAQQTLIADLRQANSGFVSVATGPDPAEAETAEQSPTDEIAAPAATAPAVSEEAANGDGGTLVRTAIIGIIVMGIVIVVGLMVFMGRDREPA